MKKIVSSLIAAGALFFIFGTSVFAEESNPAPQPSASTQSIEQLVSSTNSWIENRIAQAVTDSQALRDQYIKDVASILYGKSYQDLINQVNQAQQAVNTASPNQLADAQAKLDQLTAQLTAMQAQIDNTVSTLQTEINQSTTNLPDTNNQDVQQLESQLNAIQGADDQQTQQLTDRTLKYVQDLNNLIGALNQDITNKVNALIAATTPLGIQLEQYWIPVQIAGQTIWVDPIKIVGYP